MCLTERIKRIRDQYQSEVNNSASVSAMENDHKIFITGRNNCMDISYWCFNLWCNFCGYKLSRAHLSIRFRNAEEFYNVVLTNMYNMNNSPKYTEY